MRHINITGHIYGRLFVAEQLPHYAGETKYKYRCLCECGNTIIANAENLRSGRVKSCGCLKHEQAVNRLQNREDAILRREYSALRKRNRKFSKDNEIIDFETFKSIVKSPCFYCGDKGSKILTDRLRSRGKMHLCSNEEIRINGIDRIDCSKGYIKGNCIPSCKTCNYAKNTNSIEDFRKWVKKVHNHFVKKKKACKRIDAEQRQLTLF